MVYALKYGSEAVICDLAVFAVPGLTHGGMVNIGRFSRHPLWLVSTVQIASVAGHGTFARYTHASGYSIPTIYHSGRCCSRRVDDKHIKSAYMCARFSPPYLNSHSHFCSRELIVVQVNGALGLSLVVAAHPGSRPWEILEQTLALL
jgi:hypothetical protein